MVKQWIHSDLSLYVDDRAIYSVSKTLRAATETAIKYYGEVLTWLQENGLSIDPSKSELMTFTKTCANHNLVSTPILGARYQISNNTTNITHATHMRYLGVFLDHCLDWSRHVDIMAT